MDANRKAVVNAVSVARLYSNSGKEEGNAPLTNPAQASTSVATVATGIGQLSLNNSTGSGSSGQKVKKRVMDWSYRARMTRKDKRRAIRKRRESLRARVRQAFAFAHYGLGQNKKERKSRRSFRFSKAKAIIRFSRAK